MSNLRMNNESVGTSGDIILKFFNDENIYNVHFQKTVDGYYQLK